MTPLMNLYRVCLQDALKIRRSAREIEVHLRAAMAWLCHAQDYAGGGGVARSYSLRWRRDHQRRGWLNPYPETTGYIIPTFFNYAGLSGEAMYRERAIRMAEWEIEVQMPNGAVQGGVTGFPPSPAIFNTGQVLMGWSRAFQETRQEIFRQSAVRAAEFLLTAQDSDGAWRRNGSKYARPGVNTYDARTAWGLLTVFEITNEGRYLAAARRNFDFALSRQSPNGWFFDCCLDDNERPLLHTLAYTIEGLLEGGVILQEQRYIEAARHSAEILLSRQYPNGSLPGRFNSEWQPTVRWSCLTGDAQIAIVWQRLFQLTQDERFFEAAKRANHFLMSTQDLTSSSHGIHGAIKGSYPVWAEYSPFEYPNWAAKFFADALMLQMGLSKNRTEILHTSALENSLEVRT